MNISKNYTNEDYKKLNLDFNNNEDWDKAIKILKERIEERFLNPLNLLIDNEKDKLSINRTFGFVILSISCLLMETIQGFKEGIYNHDKKSSRLIKNFCKSLGLNEDESKFFYKNIRCGVLHKGEIEKCLLWSTSNNLNNNIFNKNSKNEKILQRTILYLKIRNEFYSYLKELSNCNELKENYVKVMNKVCKN